MADWRQDLSDILYSSFLPGLLVSVVYLIVAIVLASRRPPTSLTALDARVRVEAWWGMVLAIPAVLYVAMGGYRASWNWPAAVIAVGTVGAFAVAIAALRGADLTAWQRSIPVLLAVFALPIAVLAELGVPSGKSGVILIFGSYLGLGYAAWCVVAVRFARAVARRQQAISEHRMVLAA